MEPDNRLDLKKVLPSRKTVAALAVLLGVVAVVLFVQHIPKQTTVVVAPRPSLTVLDIKPTPTELTPLNDFYSSQSNTQTTSQAPQIGTTNPASIPGTLKNPTPATPMQKQPAPEIDSLSSTTFGPGDTLTITGKNFTRSNTVLVSIENPNRFIKIVSTDGMTLSFTFASSVVEAIMPSLNRLDTSARQALINHIISVELSKSPNPNMTDSWYVSARVLVQNENGLSNAVPVIVNMLKGI